jgi:hypothetical protein
VFRHDSLHLAARPQQGIGNHTHQTHIAAAVHHPDLSTHQFRSHFLSGSTVFGTATRTGAAENTDSPHASHSKFRVGERKDVPVWLVV